MSIFLDTAWDDFETALAFWPGMTHTQPSKTVGRASVVTLHPAVGAPFIRLQRLVEGPSGVHIDLHVQDPETAAAAAIEMGARLGWVSDHGYESLRSPGGLPFCFVTYAGESAGEAPVWDGGHRSLLDQVSIDIPSPLWDTETRFWARLTGWTIRHNEVSDRYVDLVRPTAQPVRLALCRYDDIKRVAAHVDVATDDRAAEVARHVEMGAWVFGEFSVWTAMFSPSDRRYCVTDRTPEYFATHP